MIPKKSRSWVLRSARPCLRKRTSSESSAQNSLQKNWPFVARQGCNSPFNVGSRLRQNAQHAARSVSPVYVFIGSPMNHSPGANHYSLGIAVGPSTARRGGARGGQLRLIAIPECSTDERQPR